MSFLNLKSINTKFSRPACFLINNRRKTIFSAKALGEAVLKRGVQNNLLQTVKKRTLKAVKKLDSNKNFNNSNCLPSNVKFSNFYKQNRKCDESGKNQTQTIPVEEPKYSNDLSLRLSNTQFAKEKYNHKFSYNTEVLRAANCNVSRKEFGSQAETKGCGEYFNSDGSGKKNDRKTKILIALATVLGISGIVFYFRGNNNNKNENNNKTELMSQTKPTRFEDLPKHVPYLLIGSGTAAFSAFRAIKSNDAKAKVLMVTEENRKPYMKPPLSKELWYSAKGTELSEDYKFKQWSGAERSLYFEPEQFFIDPTKLMENTNGGIAVAHGFKVKKIDALNKVVTSIDGYEISYDQCLIATGCKPKVLPVFSNASSSIKDKIMVYRTPEDFERLKRYADNNKIIAIIGNGFIGSELACSLANYMQNNNSGRIFQIFSESGNMSKVLPNYLSEWTMKKVETQGVCVLPNASVKTVTRDDSKLKLTLNTGDIITTDVVVVCVGCEANTDIAEISGLEVDNNLGGFIVNAELEARRNLFVAGDASSFYDPLLGRRRVEHHDHSVVSGRLAGENMVGKKKAYNHQSMFWSDLGPEIGYEGIGLVDSSLPTVGVFALPSKADRKSDNLTENESIKSNEQKLVASSSSTENISHSNEKNLNYGRGVVFYLKDEKIVGILLWNIFNRIGLARTIINQHKKFDDLNEVAKLFEIHS